MTSRDAIPESVKAIVRGRDECCCYYCQRIHGFFEYDHLIPHSKGGSSASNNLVYACKECNRDKRDMTGEDYKCFQKLCEIFVDLHGDPAGYQILTEWLDNRGWEVA